MLSSLAKHSDFTVATIGTADPSKPTAYARFIAWLEDWAVTNDTHLMIFYDRQQGLDLTRPQTRDCLGDRPT